jgi:hypothetical protein
MFFYFTKKIASQIIYFKIKTPSQQNCSVLISSFIEIQNLTINYYFYGFRKFKTKLQKGCI